MFVKISRTDFKKIMYSINFFDLELSNPCFAKAGDQIKFSVITKKEFSELEILVSKKSYQLFKTIIND